MVNEKRISVSFGAFAVDIEGYDDPFSVLSTLISHIKSASGAKLGEQAFGAADLENANLLASLSSTAAKLELNEDAETPRLVVRAPDQEHEVARPEADAKVAPQEVKTASVDAAAPSNADAAEIADKPEPLRKAKPEAKSEPEADAAISETAEQDETPAQDETSSPTKAEPDDITDEETAILRRVRYAITHATDADPAKPSTPKAKPKPTVSRSPADQKAEVVKDIASTLRRIGARPEGEGEGTDAQDAKDEKAEKTPKRQNPAPTKRKPLTMQMQIRPKTPATPKSGEAAKTGASAEPERTKKPVTPKIAVSRPTPPKTAEPDQPENAADSASAASQPLDREKIRERLVKLEQDDEVIDNFLFDDVEPTVSVEAVTPAHETPKAVAPDAKTTTVSAETEDDAETAEEPLLLTPAEAAPLILDKPVQEPLVLTNPIPAEPAPQTRDAEAKAPVARIVEEEPAPELEEHAEAAPQSPPRQNEPPAKDNQRGAVSEAGFARLVEARDAAIPVLVEASTRPKRRNGGPRLVALSDETRFDKSMSPQDFASHVGATSLQDMMEATAVYMAMVEGRANFSRRDVMNAFAQIETADAYSTEQRLKTFRKLQASGALTRVDEHEYALSHETRYGYETQLRA